MTLPARVPRGVWGFFDDADFNITAPGTLNTTTVNALTPAYLRTVSVRAFWQNYQPTAGSDVVGWFGMVLNQVDQHCLAARGSKLPIHFHVYTSALPPYVTASLPVVTSSTPGAVDVYGDGTLYAIHALSPGITNTAGTGMHCLCFSAPPSAAAAFGNYVPYSHTAVYQQAVKDLQDAFSTALQTYDPTRTRVPVLHFMGPAMQTKTMAGPTNQQAIFSHTGTPDPLWQTGAYTSDSTANAWTVDKHVAAWKLMAAHWASRTAAQQRAWVMTFTQDDAVLLSHETDVFSYLAGLHPLGPRAVVAKTENWSTYINSTFKHNYRLQQGLPVTTHTGTTEAQWYVQQQTPHAWEAFVPLTKTAHHDQLAAKAYAYLTPNSTSTPPPVTTPLDFTEATDILFHNTFTADYGGASSGDSDPLWLEIWGHDLDPLALSTYPEWDTWLGQIDRHMRRDDARLYTHASSLFIGSDP